jgi:hypothetical protein
VVVLGALVVAAWSPGDAAAGRSYYGWLYGTEVMPERGAELQSWIVEENNRGDGHANTSLFWWGALIGVTDQLELALPLEMTWTEADGVEPSFNFQRFGVEARYRFVSQDPEDAPEIAPLARVAVKRDVVVRDIVRVEADFVVSFERGRLHLLADAGFVGEISRHDSQLQVRPGAGISVRAVGDLRLGAEVYSELSLESGGTSWVTVGPNLAWTHGRFWLSAALGIGVLNIKTAPRLMWGIAF